jgi:aryl-alcohol dehydrogenase-like predicted oxidoreductase
MRDLILGTSGIRVSQMCLGTMTFGSAWGWGADEAACRQIYAAYRDAGGNFIDTANLYTEGESETITGRLIAGERDDIVLATKFGLAADKENPNSGGGSRKSLRRSVETSLRRLGTDYLDLLWVHAWDPETPAEATLRALDDLVRAGKVLAIGISNTPAWVVARAEAIAGLHGQTPPCAIQVAYSLAERTAERELVPMARARGLAVGGWSPLARGLLAGKDPGGRPLPPALQRAAAAAAGVASRLGTTPARVALAWVLRKGVLPVLGARTAAQLADNIAAAGLDLDDACLAELDDPTSVELGQPHDFLNSRVRSATTTGRAQ